MIHTSSAVDDLEKLRGIAKSTSEDILMALPWFTARKEFAEKLLATNQNADVECDNLKSGIGYCDEQIKKILFL